MIFAPACSATKHEHSQRIQGQQIGMASTWSCGRRREAALALNSVPRYSDGFHGGISSRMCQAVAGQSSSSARQRLPWAGGVGAAAFRHIASRDFGDSGSPVMASTPQDVASQKQQAFVQPAGTSGAHTRRSWYVHLHVGSLLYRLGMFGLLLSQVGFHRQFRDSEHCLVLAFDNVGITRAHACAAGNAASAVNPTRA